MKRGILAVCLFLFTLNSVVGKTYDNDPYNRGGHLGDLIRIFLGDDGAMLPPWEKVTFVNKVNFEVFKVIATSAQLAFDSTEYNMSVAAKYRDWLQNADRRKTYGLKSIPELSTFVSSKRGINRSQHEWYTHLGWKHDYGGEDQKKWIAGRKIFLDTLNSLFDFNLFGFIPVSGAKLESLGALLYYVHILGDHENNEVSTAFTRIPILSMDEQVGEPGWQGWAVDKDGRPDKYWRPESTIVKDLEEHLDVLFKDNKNKIAYNNLKERLKGVYGMNVSEKAKNLLTVLSHYCPILLRSAGFSGKFYTKYGL